MLISVASAISTFDQASGPKILNDYVVKQSSLKRFRGAPFSSKRSLQFHYCAQKFFRRTHGAQLKITRQNCSYSLQLFCTSKEDSLHSNHHVDNGENASRATLIWRAIKLPIYSVAFVPLTVGSAAAYSKTGIFLAKRYFVLLASSVLIITWLNLSFVDLFKDHIRFVIKCPRRPAFMAGWFSSNDVYDFDTGADKDKRESVVNLVGSRLGTLIAAYLCLVLGSGGLAWASVEAGNVRSILFLICAVICGYIYQCPPFRLSYQGLGEPLCFAAFGPFATTAFYLALGSTSDAYYSLNCAIVAASFLVGLTTTLILFCSHFHQIEGDKAVGKMSPLVRLGTERGSGVVKVGIVTLYSLLFALGLIRTLPLTCIFFCALTLPMGNLVVNFIEENHKETEKIFMAKYYCVRLHALFGAALAAGFVAARSLSC